MMLECKTPKARREARSYCRRCLAVMLCCVFAFGLTVRVTPRAQASAAVAAVEVVSAGAGGMAAGALATNPIGASIGSLLLTAVGIDFAVGYFDHNETRYYGNPPYELGAECWDYLYGLGGDIADWCMSTETTSKEKGGILPGDLLNIPAVVAEAVRLWAVENVDFTSGDAVYSQCGIFSGDTYLLFSQFPVGAVYKGMYNYSTYGTSIACPPPGQTISYQFEDKNGTVFRYDFYRNSKNQFCRDFYNNGEKVLSGGGYAETDIFTFAFAPQSADSSRYLAIRPSGRRADGTVYPVQCVTAFTSSSKYYMAEENLPLNDSFNLSSSLAKNPVLDTEKAQDFAVTVPADIPVTQVGGVTVPVVGTLTGEDLLPGAGEEDKPVPDATPWDRILEGLEGIEGKVSSLPQDIANSVTDALPVTGTIAGDQTVAQVMAEPDDLGALMITKFPFSIPWDVTKAITLLAAPPVTPRWEVDFMEPISDNVGGFEGDTTIVIDFSEYEIVGIVTRWTSIIMFIYALASGTKRLMWTA